MLRILHSGTRLGGRGSCFWRRRGKDVQRTLSRDVQIQRMCKPAIRPPRWCSLSSGVSPNKRYLCVRQMLPIHSRHRGTWMFVVRRWYTPQNKDWLDVDCFLSQSPLRLPFSLNGLQYFRIKTSLKNKNTFFNTFFEIPRGRTKLVGFLHSL